VFTTYLDASGTRLDSEVVTIAGFVAEVQQWVRFEKEWADVLKLFAVPYLHMVEFAQFTGPFKSWRNQEQKRREFLDRLSRIIARRARRGFYRSVRVKQFDVLNRSHPVEEMFLSPLALAGLTCVGAVNNWAQRYADGGENVIVFEDGDSDKPTLTKVLELYHNFTPIYKRKHAHPGFQAADWLAYEGRRLSSDWINKRETWSQRNYRRSVTILYDRIPTDLGDIGEREIQQLCEGLAVALAPKGLGGDL
jgi:hypothetical protein